MNKLLYFIIILMAGCTSSGNKTETGPIADFAALIKAVPDHSVYAEKGYYVWGASVVKGKDGLYHMFYSRWKSELGFNAWVTHSEIAHAVSRSPGGPFAFKDVALPKRGAAFWDGLTTHNPNVHEFDGKYYLYYMGNTGDGIAMSSLNFTHRNNQRIGVAWAENPSGPWHRMDKPLVDVSEDDNADDALMTSNPSVTKMHDGKYLILYKAVAKQAELPFGGPVTHQAAIADTPLGPIKKQPKRIFYKEGEHFPAEDPCVWYHPGNDRYYGIVKDMHGTFTGQGVSLAFFISGDGLNWEPAENPLASALEIRWTDGTVDEVDRLERAQVLLENGEPVMLYCASVIGDPFFTETFNVHIPLKNSSARNNNSGI